MKKITGIESMINRNKRKNKREDWEWMDDDSWEGIEDLPEEEVYSENFEEEEFDPDAYVAEIMSEQGMEEYYEEETEEYYEGETEEYYEEETEEYYEEETEEYYEEETEEYCEGETEEYYEEETEEYCEEETEEYYEEEAEEYCEEETEEYYPEELEERYEEEHKLLLFGAKRELPLWGRKVMDYLLIFGAVAVVFVAIILGIGFVHNKGLKDKNNIFDNVGYQLENINMIGEQGLLAMSDAQKAMLILSQPQEPVATPVPSENPEYNEEDYDVSINVKLSFTSIEKDLKIKFLNSDTGKLVGNVPFGVEVADENGKAYFWSDDDMDGIIYKKNLDAGMYKVKMQELTDEKYKTYGIPKEEKKVEVKSNIVYEKVDVSAEIKSESQVDVQKEDTKKNDEIKEEYLQDTVTWVESTVMAENYEEINRGDIPDPLTLVMGGRFVRLSAVGIPDSVEPEAPVDTPNQEQTAENTSEPMPEPMPTMAPTEAPSPTPTAAPTEAPSPTPTAVPTEAPSPTPTAVPTEAPSPTPTVVPTETPTPMPLEVTLDKKTAIVYTNETTELKVTVNNETSSATISAESSDKSVADVTISEDGVTVSGVEQGTVSITIVAQVDTLVSEPVVCTIEVKKNPKEDNTNALKDAQGREVYVFENEEYRVATYADYYSAEKFYIKKDTKYTGWQTIDGQRKYFDAAGNYVTGEHIIQGVKYNFASDGVLVTGTGVMGIDVSKWNGTIDWKAVKDSGVSYVIIRCGYRGSSQGAMIEDSKFRENIKGATEAGLKVGVYFFTQAINKSEALEEASMVLECIKDYQISYPVFLDVEPSGGRADSLDVATRTEICKTFCETIKKYNYTPGIYANKNWLEGKLDMNVLGGYKIWLAQYASEPTYQGRYDMWQYKDTGKVNGISGNVDLNMSYLGY